MSDQPEPRNQHLELNVTPETEIGVYADFANVWHTEHSFVIDFAAVTGPSRRGQDSDTGAEVISVPGRIVSRVRIPPAQVFEIMKALERQLSLWEQRTGRKP